MTTQNLVAIGLRQSLNIFREINLRQFYESLKLLTEKGVSNRKIACVVGHTEFSVRQWQKGGIPTDKTVILVVNRWAQSIKDSC